MSLINFGSSLASQTNIVDPARLTNDLRITQIPGLGNLATDVSSFASSITSNIPTMRITPDASQLPSTAPFSGTDADQAKKAGTASESNKITFSPKPNPLNAFDQATYSVRFSILGDDPNSNREIVIAETGKTNLNIQSFVIETMQAPSSANRNAPAIKFELKIFEPYGSNLPDMMISSAKAIGTHNYTKGPWKISVKFQGFDPKTGKPNTDLIGKTWEWTVALLELQSKVTEAGSNHTLTFIPKNDLGFQDQFAKFTDSFSISIEDGETIGSLLNKIIVKMNDMVRRKYDGPFIDYSIEDIPYDSPVAGVSRPFENKLDTSNGLFKSSRSGSVQVSGGTSLMVLIDSILGASPTVVKMANAATRDNDNNPNKNLDVNSIFHSVSAEVTIVDYNERAKDYNRKMKYIIKPYSSIKTISNFEQQKELADPAKNQAKANFIVQNTFLSKIYDYIFTGKNTEVLKFDINLNFQWYMVTDANFGSIHYDAATYARAANPDAISRVNASSNIEMQGSAAQPGFNGAEPPATSASPAVTANAAQPSSSTPPPARQSAAEKNSTTPSNITYADDLQNGSATTFEMFPVSISQQNNVNRTQNASFIESDFSKQRSAYGLLLNQLYSGGQSQKNLISIQLEIRGDPYWLGANLDDKPQTGTGVNSLPVPRPDNLPIFHRGDYIFILRFNLPQGFDESSGSAKVVESEVFTGFYTCFKVVHNFKDGEYTQTLFGTRIIGMEVAKLLNIVYGK